MMGTNWVHIACFGSEAHFQMRIWDCQSIPSRWLHCSISGGTGAATGSDTCPSTEEEEEISAVHPVCESLDNPFISIPD